jgi:hypothetical protein
MKIRKIITHPGGAHFDEVAAVSLVLAVHSRTTFQIERREPVPAELDDPDIWVIDVGDRHEPARLNFDHHQDAACPASFVLVAEYLGLKEIMSVLPWWDFKDNVDRIGPTNASLQFNAGDELVNRNPVETWLTDYFAENPQASLPMLRNLGRHLIEGARALKKQIDYWKSIPLTRISGVPAVIGDTRESLGLEEFRRLVKNPPDIVISMDRRGEGWRLFRYEGSPVDFSRIAGRPEVEFAHKTGFLAKTREKLPLEKLLPLVARAVVKKDNVGK